MSFLAKDTIFKMQATKTKLDNTQPVEGQKIWGRGGAERNKMALEGKDTDKIKGGGASDRRGK